MKKVLFTILCIFFIKDTYAIICNYNAYNCSDLGTQSQAQYVYNYCGKITGYDIHWLDDDNDGIACEWNNSYSYSSYRSCPINSYMSNGNCYCNTGYCSLGNKCYEKPNNAYCYGGDKYNAWKCNNGYKEVGNYCYKMTDDEICKNQYGYNSVSIGNNMCGCKKFYEFGVNNKCVKIPNELIIAIKEFCLLDLSVIKKYGKEKHINIFNQYCK